MDRLRICYLENAGCNLSRVTRLLELIVLFENHRIEVVPFKGPVLAESAYGDLALRQFVDLDILIHKCNARNAFQLLLSKGYRPEINLNAKQIYNYSKTEYSLAANHKNSNLAIELHWEVTGRYTAYPFDLDLLEKKLERTTLLGKEVNQISAEDMLVYLCIHGSKDGWNNLDSICCIAELVQSRSNIEWHRVQHLAAKIHCQRMLYLGLYLANRLLDVEIPTHILKRIKADPVTEKVAAKVIQSLFVPPVDANPTPISYDFSMFHLGLKDRNQDKLRHILNMLFLPSRQDWRFFHLPANLSYLYYPLRPIRLAGEILSTYTPPFDTLIRYVTF
jgi:hypothetical protein